MLPVNSSRSTSPPEAMLNTQFSFTKCRLRTVAEILSILNSMETKTEYPIAISYIAIICKLSEIHSLSQLTETQMIKSPCISRPFCINQDAFV